VKPAVLRALILTILLVLISTQASAHDPIFGMGPHVLFKGGIETSLNLPVVKADKKQQFRPALELTYGITGDWSAGLEVPYAFNQVGNKTDQGLSDLSIFTKYRFWRKDSLGAQQSAAVLLKVKTSTGDETSELPVGTGTTDSILGLAYGYESRRWYRWASARYRRNGTNNSGFHRGNKLLLDFVAGIRPKLTSYTEPDTVLLLELNGELADPADINGTDLANTGGDQWFLSPGIFWTRRNIAIKAAVQIPILNNLNGNQEQDDYRLKVVFELHK